MNDLNKRIRQAQRQMFIEKLKENIWLVLTLVSLIVSYSAYNFIPTASHNVEGIVIDAPTTANAAAINPATLTIRLTKDHEVQVKIPNNMKHPKSGTRVELEEKTTFLFNVKSYQFIKSID